MMSTVRAHRIEMHRNRRRRRKRPRVRIFHDFPTTRCFFELSIYRIRYKTDATHRTPDHQRSKSTP